MAAIAEALRRDYPAVLASVLRRVGQLEASEDAVQEAVARALEVWPQRGLPDQPRAWLTRVALNHHIDGVRRQGRSGRHATVLAALAEQCPWSQGLVGMPEAASWNDDMLRLIFTCCDPVLGLEEQTALALSNVAGLSTGEIARAFLVAPRAMEQRLTRARRRLRERRGQYEVPRRDVAPERLEAVLGVIHFVFNEGYWSSGGEDPIRSDVAQLALSLARSLDDLLPREPEVRGLLALLLLHAGRLPARRDEAGQPVSLEEQNRTLWHSETIDEACALLREALDRGSPGPYQIEAAIAAVHSSSPDAGSTDWPQIAVLYESLERYRASPVVRVNRAFAAGRAFGPEEGLRLLESVRRHPALERYPYAHLVHGVLLEEAGREGEAVAALQRAVAEASNEVERAQLQKRLDALLS